MFLFLVGLCDVEALVDDLGDGPDLCPELLLDPVQSEPVVVGDEVDCNTQVAEAAGSTDAMQVRLGHLREVEVDDHVHGLNVNTTSEQIWKKRKR